MGDWIDDFNVTDESDSGRALAENWHRQLGQGITFQPFNAGWKPLNLPLAATSAASRETCGVQVNEPATREDTAKYFDAVKAMIEGGS